MIMTAISILMGVGKRLWFCLQLAAKQNHRSGISDLIKRATLVWSWNEYCAVEEQQWTVRLAPYELYFFGWFISQKKYCEFGALDGYRLMDQRSYALLFGQLSPKRGSLLGRVKVKKMIFAWRLIYLGFYPSLAVYQVCFMSRGNGNP